MPEPIPQGDVSPVEIQRDGESSIVIRWSDESTTTWTARELRQSCPCATCREKRRGEKQTSQTKPRMLPVLSAAEARPLGIESMRPVGTYAYNIGFTDGHSSGLFTFAMLNRTSSPADDGGDE